MTDTPNSDYEPDPVFISSRREAKWILLMWIACLIWTMTICGSLGYRESVDSENFATVLGIPRWVALGIVLPWLVTNVATIWFCLSYMQDHELEEPTSDEHSPEALR